MEPGGMKPVGLAEIAPVLRLYFGIMRIPQPVCHYHRAEVVCLGFVGICRDLYRKLVGKGCG